MAGETVSSASDSTPPALEVGEIQALVLTGYGFLPHARYVLAEIVDPASFRTWLGHHLDEITTGDRRGLARAVNVAFTRAGLAALGLGDDRVDGLCLEFREGMAHPDRQRVLGDHGPSAPDRWRWGGPGRRAVHLCLLLYAEDADSLDDLESELLESPAAPGLGSVERLATSHTMTEGRVEHFGFADGIAQPAIAGYKPGHPDNTLAPGEFVLGYPNEYGDLPLAPALPAAEDPDDLLPPVPGEPGKRDLGRNGSYLVFRQLAQDVVGFWSWVDERARELGRPPEQDPRLWLAAKMVGRWPDGTPLVKSPERPDPELAGDDAFGYRDVDPRGLRCPVGSHIRRTNPRDSLPGTRQEATAVARRHRILRRGRAYGEPAPSVAPSATPRAPTDELDPDAILRADRDAERGLHFICINTDIARQFEFMQQTWANNSKFGGLYEDPDPVAAGHPRKDRDARFTVPREPVRERCRHLPTFITTVGGSYFFLPGMRALRFLATGGRGQ